MVVPAAHVARPMLLWATTTATMLALTEVLTALSEVHWVCIGFAMWWFLAVLLAPFWLVPLHFKLQSPPESSAAQAFMTALPAWLIACIDVGTRPAF